MTMDSAATSLFSKYGKYAGLGEEQFYNLMADGCEKRNMATGQIYNGLRLALSLEYGQREYFTDKEAAGLLEMDFAEIGQAMNRAGIRQNQDGRKIYYFPSNI